MDWKLQKIELENFKFFKKPFEFPLNGKNILLYGENGSGKSSIVWGLYTLMESHKKPLVEIQKYFNPDNDQNLRNRYSTRTEHSSIKTTFIPEGRAVLPKDYEISDTNISTKTAGDDFIRLTTAAFDMFNYRMLSDWIYKKNSSSIDLFKGFEKDIFKYLYFSGAYTRIDGTAPTQDGKTAEEWWEYIKSVRLPLTRRVHRDEFVMTVSNEPASETVQFDVTEKWTSISVGGNRYFKDVKVKVLSSTTALVDAHNIKHIAKAVIVPRTSLGLSTPLATPPAMESTIKNRHSGQDLTSI